MVALTWVGTVSPSGVLNIVALALLAVNSCVATRRALSHGDASSALFVAVATLFLAALLATVRAHEHAGDAAARGRRGPMLKALAWALSAALTGMFAHRVAALAPTPPLAVLVWSMGAATVAYGFYCLSVQREGFDDGDQQDE